MKNVCFLSCFFLVTTLSVSCHKDELKPEQDLYDQLAGEWQIEKIIFPAKDSVVILDGQAVFAPCDAYHSGQCEGSFSLNNETVRFRYQVTHFSGIPSKINIGPLEQDQNNMLDLQRASYDILTLDKNHLTLDLAFCTYDADSSCVTTHRHVAMVR